MKKVIFWILIIILIGSFIFILEKNKKPKTDDSVENHLVEYFIEEIQEKVIDRIGQPIEGFNAYIVNQAFPGIIAEDFIEVETNEGIYTFEKGELVFKRTQEEIITSAEEAINKKGMETLLKNLATRFKIDIYDKNSVDQIINKIESAQISEIIETKINQEGSALGIKIIPTEIIEDSRCPTDVECIQAGTVRIKALLSSGLGESNQEFELGYPITTEAESIVLLEVIPEASVGKEIFPEEYTFVFKISKR